MKHGEHEERRPLLQQSTSSGLGGDQPSSGQRSASGLDLEALRIRAAAEPPLEDWPYLERENLPAYMVGLSMAKATVQVTVVLGAYFFVQSSGHRFTPRCRVLHGPELWTVGIDQSKLQAHACYVTTFCFWTFPILCPLVVIAVFWKNLMDKRLFYECLLNRIFLCYSSKSYLQSPTFWFLVVYLAVAMGSVAFAGRTRAWQGQSPGHELGFAMLAYLSPIFAFLVVLFTQWSANQHLISLPKFMERDRSKAITLLNRCTYVLAHDFERAAAQAEAFLERAQETRREPLELATPEVLKLVLDHHFQRKASGISTQSFWEEADCSSCHCQRAYWVTHLLHLPFLKDARSRRFRQLARLYSLFMLAAVAFFVWALAYTVQQFLVFHHASSLDLLPAPEKIVNPSEVLRGLRRIQRIQGPLIGAA